MDYDFINNLISTLSTSNIFKYTFTGFKVLAFGILTLKLIDKLTKSIGKDEIPLGEFYSLLGIMFLIGSSDFIIDSIEQVFSSVQMQMNATDTGKIENVMKEIEERQNEAFIDAEFWYEYLALFVQEFFNNILSVFLWIGIAILKIVDMTVTISYLVLRVFYLQLLKFVFPVVLALSTFDTNLSFLQSWIKRYIGVYILGIAYIGILNFCQLVISSLTIELTWDLLPISTSGLGAIVVAIVVINIKIKLFSNVTSYITGMFQ